ncbi:MAG TPA: GDP-mannose 4,6-dehydratase [Candidatus Dormibacteraeota bacterium]|nr:GDP-mannose 4,6-dehydratase [Candidatus Dormibacteraeota bacterium]
MDPSTPAAGTDPQGRSGTKREKARRRLLVTGGAGFLGVNAAVHFIEKGWHVTLLDNLSRPGTERNLNWLLTRHPTEATFIKEDVRNAGALAEHVKDQDAILHLAGQVAVTTSLVDPNTDFDVNARGTLNVLEAVRLHNREAPLVFASTNKVYGKLEHNNGACKETQPIDFHSPYGCSKGAADQYVRDYARCFQMNTVVLRQSCIYGAHQYGTEDQGWVAHFVHSILNGRALTIYGDGSQVRDLLDARDLSALYATVIEKIGQTRGEIYNVGGGTENQRNLLEVIRQIGELTNTKPQYTFADWREGDQAYYVSDISKAKNDLGWEPRIPFGRGLNDLIQWASSQR